VPRWPGRVAGTTPVAVHDSALDDPSCGPGTVRRRNPSPPGYCLVVRPRLHSRLVPHPGPPRPIPLSVPQMIVLQQVVMNCQRPDRPRSLPTTRNAHRVLRPALHFARAATPGRVRERTTDAPHPGPPSQPPPEPPTPPSPTPTPERTSARNPAPARTSVDPPRHPPGRSRRRRPVVPAVIHSRSLSAAGTEPLLS